MLNPMNLLGLQMLNPLGLQIVNPLGLQMLNPLNSLFLLVSGGIRRLPVQSGRLSVPCENIKRNIKIYENISKKTKTKTSAQDRF